MRRLSRVQARTLFAVGTAVLLLVPGWTGEPRLPLLPPDTQFAVVPRPDLRGGLGAFRVVRAWEMTGRAPGFGGFSAIAVAKRRLTLLSDGGNFIRFDARGGAGASHHAGSLPSGPATGWTKRERDSEAIVVAGEHAWVGFERANGIWRYDTALARGEAMARPVAMRHWEVNGGAEAVARLPDGRFVVIAEEAPRRPGPRPMLLFSGDPTAAATRTDRLAFAPPEGYDPSDAAALPDGDLLVLVRRFRPPFDFSAKLVRVPRADLRGGNVAAGTVVTTLQGRYGYNWEGVAVTQEEGRLVLWLVNDNDAMPLRRSLLLKLELATLANGPPRERQAVP